MNTEITLKNETLLSNIRIRQKNLHSLSKYLSELESQLALIFAASPDIIVFLDEDARIIKISNAVQTILGYEREEMFHKSIWEYIATEDVEKTKNFFFNMKNRKLICADNRHCLVNHWIGKSGERVRLIWRFSVCDEREHTTIGVATKDDKESLQECSQVA